MKFVNPKNDVAFKKIFGSEGKTEILIGLLNAVLGLTGDKEIKAIQLLNPYQTPSLETLKMTILDIRATDKRDITYIIEMQIEHVAGALKRFTYYTAKAYSSQIERGEDYPKLNQVIFIGLLDFKLIEKTTAYLSRHQILDTATHWQELKDLEFVFIELPKFEKNADEVRTILEKWVYFIKHAEDLDVIPVHVDDVALKTAYEEADRFGWSKQDLELYEHRSIRIQDARGALALAKQIGIKKGEQKGRNNERFETARRMKADGLVVDLIAKYTGLSPAEIEALGE